MEKFKIVILSKRPDGVEAYGVEINGKHLEFGSYVTDNRIAVVASPLNAILTVDDLNDYADAIKFLAAYMATKLKPLIVVQ